MRRHSAVGLGVLVLGCGGSHTSPQTPVEARAPSPVSAPSASAAPTLAKASESAPATISTAKVHTEGQHYVLDGRAPAILSVGGTGELEIVLVARDGYHINDEFPYKLRTSVEPAGTVTFEKAEYARSEGSYTKTEARFKAKFAGARAGDSKIGCVMALSVCTTKECVTDKVQLEVPVTVR